MKGRDYLQQITRWLQDIKITGLLLHFYSLWLMKRVSSQNSNYCMCVWSDEIRNFIYHPWLYCVLEVIQKKKQVVLYYESRITIGNIYPITTDENMFLLQFFIFRYLPQNIVRTQLFPTTSMTDCPRIYKNCVIK